MGKKGKKTMGKKGKPKSQKDRKTERKVSFSREPCERIAQLSLSKKLCGSANKLIAKLTVDRLRDKSDTMIENTVRRIDMQGTFPNGMVPNGMVPNGKFYNIQLQLKKNKKNAKDSTSFAALLVPWSEAGKEITDRRLRHGLLLSLEGRVKVTIELS